ncbi:hypothetical protein K466DRAFT_498578 [Polyporus arcularius HHB13444]|uniref:Uncharacterized protein n=1 Tax=Polyporus arcularius HHB13444 TaxID=1314778 RepID=A0A5C3P511_9APHY|nr:hypothetical protein K466DRAFT_498578 [Polyporus arcularius HHB13444]
MPGAGHESYSSTSRTPGQESTSPFSASFDPNGPTPPIQSRALRENPLHPSSEIRVPEHETNSSTSTLVTSNSTPGQEIPSPFSASFDPNGSTPPIQSHALALRESPLQPITEVSLPGGGVDVSALWAHRLSASFGAIADQIAAASQALATVPASASVSAAPLPVGETSHAEIIAMKSRLDIIESTQAKLAVDLQQVQAQLAQIQVNGHGRNGRAEKQSGDVTVVEVEGDGGHEFKSAAEIAIEELQKRVDGVIDTIKLDQARLYARLQNATVTSNKMLIKAPMMANGKTPQNFPSTKGEFEHLTKERYEHLLKSYNVPTKGDTNAKREALREFIGLTPAN